MLPMSFFSHLIVVKNEAKIAIPPPQFAIHQVDPTTVFIEAILPAKLLAKFDDTFDIYSKSDTNEDQWKKVIRAGVSSVKKSDGSI